LTQICKSDLLKNVRVIIKVVSRRRPSLSRSSSEQSEEEVGPPEKRHRPRHRPHQSNFSKNIHYINHTTF
ncbi:MAG: hypothetical protein KAI16_00580, partial [Candidatus Pacebacteria bacterium]|nr:hypothetical protein [Candidatus Paceibacterota bacterium]